ncbi:MAG: hypothetical protein OEM98_08170 [Gammaproteobacteria bacterium]|nr:hypothetical protein [Gammaproteobacteria bacterium]
MFVVNVPISEKARAAAAARSDAREEICSLLRALTCQLSEAIGEVDDPESAVTIQIPVSKTLALQWCDSLRYALKLI